MALGGCGRLAVSGRLGASGLLRRSAPFHPGGPARALGEVALPQRLHRKTGMAHRGRDRPGKVATTGNRLPDRLDPVLPALHIGIRRAPMFEKQQRSARPEDAAQLGQNALRLRHRAQRIRTHHCIEAFASEGDRLTHPRADIGGPAVAGRFGPGEIEQLVRWVDPGKCGHGLLVIEPLIEPAAAANFKNRTARPGHDLPAQIHNGFRAATGADDSGHHVPIPDGLDTHANLFPNALTLILHAPTRGRKHAQSAKI